MQNRLRVGMIGYRFMGKAHSNAWRQAPHFFPLKADIEMHTICGRDAKAVEEAQKQLGWKNASTDWKQVVNSPEIDIIDINTPNDSHAEIAIAAAKAGKHILCEKPLAMNVAQCQEMVDAAKKAKIVHMVCHNYRRIPAIALAKKLIDEGALANLEATRFALGRKTHIQFEINGSKGSLHFDFEDMNRLKFFDNPQPADRQGFRDILVTQPGGTHPFVGAWWPPGHIIGYEHTFVHTIADFVNAVVNGKPVQPTFEDGLKNERVLEAVEESANSRQWVKV